MGPMRDASLKRAKRVSGVKANSWGRISVKDPVLKGRKGNCRDKMGKGMLKGRGQWIQFLPKISMNSGGRGIYKSGSWRRFTYPTLLNRVYEKR